MPKCDSSSPGALPVGASLTDTAPSSNGRRLRHGSRYVPAPFPIRRRRMDAPAAVVAQAGRWPRRPSGASRAALEGPLVSARAIR